MMNGMGGMMAACMGSMSALLALVGIAGAAVGAATAYAVQRGRGHPAWSGAGGTTAPQESWPSRLRLARYLLYLRQVVGP